MDVIEQIGAYAGLAAVVGLGVLSALYFSQARDLKRLREWAGRAPERIPAPRPPVMARPIPRPPGPATMPPRPPIPPVPRPPGAAPGVGAVTPAAGAAPPPAPDGPPPTVVGAPPPRPGQPPLAPPVTVAPPPAPAAASAGAAPPEVKAPPPGDEETGGGTPAEAPEPATTAGPSGDTATSAPSPATPAAAAAAGTAVPPRESANGSEEQATGSQDTVQDAPAHDDEDEFDRDESGDDRLDQAELEHAEPFEDDDDLLEDDDPRAPERHWEDPLPVEPSRAVPGRPTIPIGAGREPEPIGAADSPPILPPYSQSRPGAEPPGGRPGGVASPGRILGVIAATVVAAVLVALAVSQLGGDDGGGSQAPAERSEASSPNARENGSRAAGVDPGSVTVAVLNGTTVPGLAAQIGDSIKRRGFQLGNVTNFIDQQRAESVVMYAPGAEREAAAVGRRLDIAQRAPVDAESQDIAGDATVVVIAGADQTP